MLHSSNTKEFRFEDVAEDVRERLKAIGFDRVSLVQIDPFDMNSVINAILAIVEKDRPPFYINITGGTNLMAGAACAAAFFVGARAYYVLGKKGIDIQESKVIELPIPNIPYFRTLQKTQLSILRNISDLGGSTSNSALRVRSGMSAQSISYNIRELERKALITTRRDFRQRETKAGVVVTKPDRRKLMVELTNAGKLFLSWSKA